MLKILIILENPTKEIVKKINLDKKIINLVIRIINWSSLITKSRILGINNKQLINEEKNKIPIKVIIGFIEITLVDSYSEFKLDNALKITWEDEFMPIPNKNKNIESKNISFIERHYSY